MANYLRLVFIIAMFLIACTLQTSVTYDKTDEECGFRCHYLVTGEDGVSDDALTASTMHNVNHAPRQGRLFYVQESRYHSGSWCPLQNKLGDYIQVRFKEPKMIYKILLQGRHGANLYVTEFKFSTSEDCNKFTDYGENGQAQIFPGSVNYYQVVTRVLKTPIKALCARIHIVKKVGHPCMRFELIGRKACRGGATYIKGACYDLVKEKVNWLQAEGFCRRQGGHLVTVDSITEQAALSTYLVQQASRYTVREGKTCPGSTLGRMVGHTVSDCLHQCLAMPICTAFMVKVSTRECWWKAGCTESNLQDASGVDAHLLPARVHDIWIGLNRLADYDEWQVSQDQRGSYNNWAYLQPQNDYNEKCAAMSPLKEYEWTSKACSDLAHFVCETYV